MQVESPNEELNKELNKLRTVVESQEVQIASFEAKIEELKREIKEVGTGQERESFKFELAAVSRFFESGFRQPRERFWARGVQWSLEVKRTEVGETHLGVFLKCHEASPKWSCEVSYSLILFNHRSENLNRVKTFTKTFGRYLESGSPKFMSYAELIDERNGYIKNDKIVLGVVLKVGPMIRV